MFSESEGDFCIVDIPTATKMVCMAMLWVDVHVYVHVLYVHAALYTVVVVLHVQDQTVHAVCQVLAVIGARPCHPAQCERLYCGCVHSCTCVVVHESVGTV